MGFIDGMNSSTSSTVQQQEADASWPSHESWEHPVGTAGTVVLDSRQILPQRSCALNSRQDTHHSRLDWEWEAPMLLTQHSATCSEDQESEDCKPNIMADHNLLVGCNLHQHNSLNPLSFHSNNLSHNSITWGLQSPSFCGETAMVDSSSSTFLAAAPGPFGQHAIGGMAIPGICGLSTGHNLGLGDPRSTLEQQHRHLLELVHMDHQRRVQDNIVPDFATRLGLNLGGRTYFSAEDHLSSMMSFGKRHRPNSPGAQVPMCQAEGCKADLSFAKHYHRRHKVCEFHSKASNVIIGGQTQRFCQQCSRFHMLSEFDEGKRSCRKRLADHNRRRRKPQPAAAAASAATTTSTTTELTLPKSTDHNQDQNPRKDDRPSGSQTKAVAASIDSPSLLSTMSLAPTSVPLMLQNGKKQLHLLSGRHQEKEAYQKFVEGHSNSSTSSTHRQSSSHNHNGLEIGPWLKTIASKSPNTGISDSSSSNRQLLDSAGGSSTMQALSLRMQNLSALQPKSDHMDNPDWVKKNMSGQQMQTVREMETCNHPNLQEVIQKQQLQLSSNSSTNVNGIDFQGLIGLRPYNNQSVYSNHE